MGGEVTDGEPRRDRWAEAEWQKQSQGNGGRETEYGGKHQKQRGQDRDGHRPQCCRGRDSGQILALGSEGGAGTGGWEGPGRFKGFLRDRATCRNRQPGETGRSWVWGWQGSQAHPRDSCRGEHSGKR